MINSNARERSSERCAKPVQKTRAITNLQKTVQICTAVSSCVGMQPDARAEEEAMPLGPGGGHRGTHGRRRSVFGDSGSQWVVMRRCVLPPPRTVSALILGSFDFGQIAISSIGFVILATRIAICPKSKLPKIEADTVAPATRRRFRQFRQWG